MIRTKGPINKVEIARVTDLSIPTVMKLTDVFIRNGLVRMIGKGESNGGKRPELLEFIPDAYYIVGVDVGRSKMKVVVTDLGGNIISKQVALTGRDASPEKIIDRLKTLIETTINESTVEKAKLIGMGIGMPGLLDVENGIVLFSPDFHWENVNLIKPISNFFQMPIHLENSNRAQAMGEKWFGIGVDSDYFISVSLGHGIGSAIVEEGEFYRGSSGSSGELGHVTLDKEGPCCDCGNYGCLEVLASGNAIAGQAQKLILDGKPTSMLALAGGDASNVDAKIVFDAARSDDAAARRLVDQAAEYIGIGLANYINLLDPDMIILAGGLTHAGDILTDGIKKTAKERQMKFAGRKVKICVAKLGDDGKTGKSLPQCFLIDCTISVAKRSRFSRLPPKRSVRWFIFLILNWSSKQVVLDVVNFGGVFVQTVKHILHMELPQLQQAAPNYLCRVFVAGNSDIWPR